MYFQSFHCYMLIVLTVFMQLYLRYYIMNLIASYY